MNAPLTAARNEDAGGRGDAPMNGANGTNAASCPEACLALVRFDHKNDNRPKPITATWPQLAARLTRHETRAQKDGPAWSPAAYLPDATRGAANVQAVTCFVGDVDDGTAPDALRDRWQGLAWCLYSTHSSAPDKPKWRVAFPLVRPVPAADWTAVHRKLTLALLGEHSDPACKDCSRLYYLPSCPPDALSHAFADVQEGAPLDPDAYPDPDPMDAAGAQMRYTLRERPRMVGEERSSNGDNRPGDDYNARGPVLELLQSAGWQMAGQRGDKATLRRPGKAEGLSATFGFGDAYDGRMFFCFTSSAPPFEPNTGYSPFAVYTLVKTGGDSQENFAEAARQLGREGYGDPPKSPLTRRVEKQQTAQDRREQEREDAARALETFGPAAEQARAVVVVNSRQQREVSDEAKHALYTANRARPLLFARVRGLVLLATARDEHAYSVPISPDHLAFLLRRSADWVKASTGKDGEANYSPAGVPPWLAGDLLADPTLAGGLPFLRAVVGCPVVARNGDLLTRPGHDAQSGLYLDIAPITMPLDTSAEAARAAAGRLFGKGGTFAEFPYVSDADRANALALFLTPFLRAYIAGPVPMAVVEAPAPGTGKTLLAESLLAVSTPGLIVSDTPSERDRDAAAEWSKLLPSLLAGAPAAVLLDNMRGTISSATLEALLTSGDVVTVRKLGKSDETVQMDAGGLTLAATGNNAVFSRDMARRCYFIRLDAGMEAPDQRADFGIPDLRAHIRERRFELLGDVLSILGAWIAAGRPEGKAHKGSFDRWADVLSGVLDVAGIKDFLANDAQRAEAADPETLAWRGFFAAWRETHGSAALTAKELVELAAEHEIIGDAFASGASRALGRRLQGARDRVFGDNRLTATTGHGGILRFSLRLANRAEDGGFGGFGGFSNTPNAQEKREETHNVYVTTVQEPTKPTKPTAFEEGIIGDDDE